MKTPPGVLLRSFCVAVFLPLLGCASTEDFQAEPTVRPAPICRVQPLPPYPWDPPRPSSPVQQILIKGWNDIESLVPGATATRTRVCTYRQSYEMQLMTSVWTRHPLKVPPKSCIDVVLERVEALNYCSLGFDRCQERRSQPMRYRYKCRDNHPDARVYTGDPYYGAGFYINENELSQPRFSRATFTAPANWGRVHLLVSRDPATLNICSAGQIRVEASLNADGSTVDTVGVITSGRCTSFSGRAIWIDTSGQHADATRSYQFAR